MIEYKARKKTENLQNFSTEQRHMVWITHSNFTLSDVAFSCLFFPKFYIGLRYWIFSDLCIFRCSLPGPSINVNDCVGICIGPRYSKEILLDICIDRKCLTFSFLSEVQLERWFVLSWSSRADTAVRVSILLDIERQGHWGVVGQSCCLLILNAHIGTRVPLLLAPC